MGHWLPALFTKVHFLSAYLASFRRPVSWGAAQRTAREITELFLFFWRAVFRAAPQLTERLEEASAYFDAKKATQPPLKEN